MKEITRTREITETYSIEAYDGTRFNIDSNVDIGTAKLECIAYEKSAKMVAYRAIQNIKIAEFTQYDITNGEGSEKYKIELYKPRTDEDIRNLKIYLQLKNKGENRFLNYDFKKDEEVMICWDYAEEFFWIYTLESWIKGITDNYYKEIEKWKEKKENETKNER